MRRAPQFFFGGGIQHAERADDSDDEKTADSTPSITAQGRVSSSGHVESIWLRFTNRTLSPIRLSYLVDEYIAYLSDGRTVKLDKDFLTYPDILRSDSEASVTLLIPNGLSASDITRIVSKLNSDQTVVLKSITPLSAEPFHARAQKLAGFGMPDSTIGRKSSAHLPPLEMPVDTTPAIISSPTIPPEPDPQLAGTIPAIVELRQELGSAIKVELRWNQEPPITRLSPGDQETFALVAGQHELWFTSRIPPLGETQGFVPVIATAGEPLQITLDARARMSGPEVRIRVWQKDKLAWDQNFKPISTTR